MSRNNRKERIKACNRRLKEAQIQTPFINLNKEFDELAKLSPSEKLKVIRENSVRANLSFNSLIKELEKESGYVDPLYTLAVTLFYRRTSVAGDEWTNQNAFLQSDYEVLQATLLKRHYNDYVHPPNTFVACEFAGNIGELVRKSAREFLSLKDAEALDTLSDEKLTAKYVSEQMKSQTQFIRNWGTVPQMIRYVKKIFEPLEGDIEKETGLRVASLLEMYKKIVEKAETRAKLFDKRNFMIEEIVKQIV